MKMKIVVGKSKQLQRNKSKNTVGPDKIERKEAD